MMILLEVQYLEEYKFILYYYYDILNVTFARLFNLRRSRPENPLKVHQIQIFRF